MAHATTTVTATFRRPADNSLAANGGTVTFTPIDARYVDSTAVTTRKTKTATIDSNGHISQVLTITTLGYQITATVDGVSYTFNRVFTLSTHDLNGDVSVTTPPTLVDITGSYDDPDTAHATGTVTVTSASPWEVKNGNIYLPSPVVYTITSGALAGHSNKISPTAIYHVLEAPDGASTNSFDVDGSTTISLTGAVTVPTVPGTIIDLSVIAATNGAATAAFTWTAVPGASSYNLYLQQPNGQLGTTAIQTGITSPYTLSGLTNGTTYTWAVKALNATGAGAASNLVTGTPTAAADTTAPAAPVNLRATAGNAQVHIAWDLGVETDLSKYRVDRSTDGGSTWSSNVSGDIDPDTAGTEYLDTGRSNGTAYTYRVTAVDASSNVSAASLSITRTPTASAAVLSINDKIAWQDSTTTPGTTHVSGTTSTTSGSLLLVVVSIRDVTGQVTGVTDAASNTYSKILVSQASQSNATVEFWAATGTTGLSSGAVTVTTTATGKGVASHLYELVNGALPVDKSATAISAGGGGSITMLSGLTPTPAGNADIAVAAISLSGASRSPSGDTFISGAGTSSEGHTTGGAPFTSLNSGFVTLTNATAEQFTVTLSSASSWAGGIVLIQGSAAPSLGIPPSPRNFIATGGDGTVDLGWTLNADESALAYYLVYKQGSQGGYVPVQQVTPGTSSWQDTSVTNGTPYTYFVTAVTTIGDESARSRTGIATPRAVGSLSILPFDSTAPWNQKVLENVSGSAWSTAGPYTAPGGQTSATAITAISDNGLAWTADPTTFCPVVIEIGASSPLQSVIFSGHFRAFSNSHTSIGMTNQTSAKTFGGLFCAANSSVVQGIPFPPDLVYPTDSDGQVILWNPTTGEYYEFWQFYKDGSGFHATNGSYSNTGTGWYGLFADGTAGRGMGCPYLAGLVRPWEMAAALAQGNQAVDGYIHHALAMSYSTPSGNFVYPAFKSDGQNFNGVAGTDAPEGARLQLDPTKTETDFTNAGMTAEAKVIARTCQRYGTYVADHGGSSKLFYHEHQLTAGWDLSKINRTYCSTIPISWFQWVAPPAVQPQ